MLEHFRQTDSLAGVLFQHLFQQSLQSQACAVPHLSCEGELRVLRVFDYFILAIGVKWQLTADQRVDEAPKAQTSHWGPYGSSLITSGATYPSVPNGSFAVSFGPSSLLSPKSTSLTYKAPVVGSLEVRIFSSFTSR